MRVVAISPTPHRASASAQMAIPRFTWVKWASASAIGQEPGRHKLSPYQPRPRASCPMASSWKAKPSWVARRWVMLRLLVIRNLQGIRSLGYGARWECRGPAPFPPMGKAPPGVRGGDLPSRVRWPMLTEEGRLADTRRGLRARVGAAGRAWPRLRRPATRGRKGADALTERMVGSSSPRHAGPHSPRRVTPIRAEQGWTARPARERRGGEKGLGDC